MSRKNVGIISAVIFAIMIIVSFSLYKGMETDYIIEKGHIASEKINQISNGNLFPTVSSSAYDEIVQKRNMCIAGMVIGTLGTIISLLVAFVRRDEIKTYNDTSGYKLTEESRRKETIYSETPDKAKEVTLLTYEQRLKDLQELFDKGYISPEEYQEKREEIIKNL